MGGPRREKLRLLEAGGIDLVLLLRVIRIGTCTELEHDGKN